MKDILIPDKNGKFLQISEEDFLKQFPDERSYLEYLKLQTFDKQIDETVGNEIIDSELLSLAQFIYDEPAKDSIPLMDIGLKIHSLNMKIEYGIGTSIIACEKIKQHNREVPCTPYPANIFWAKLRGITPLQFLEQSFDATISIDDAIKFSLAENKEISSIWDKYKPLLNKYAQHEQNPSTEIELAIGNDKRIDAKEFNEIMNGNAALKFLEYERSDKMQVFVREWKNHNDKLSLCGLVYHLFDQQFLRNLNGGTSDRAVLNVAKRFFQKRYNSIDLSEHFRKEGSNSKHRLPFKDLRNY